MEIPALASEGAEDPVVVSIHSGHIAEEEEEPGRKERPGSLQKARRWRGRLIFEESSAVGPCRAGLQPLPCPRPLRDFGFSRLSICAAMAGNPISLIVGLGNPGPNTSSPGTMRGSGTSICLCGARWGIPGRIQVSWASGVHRLEWP